MIEVMGAQVTLSRARFNVVAALADHHAAQAMWLKAIGRVR